jgi:hypothetical protein
MLDAHLQYLDRDVQGFFGCVGLTIGLGLGEGTRR